MVDEDTYTDSSVLEKNGNLDTGTYVLEKNGYLE